VVCGLMLRLPVLALRLVPSTEPARHMTETILPGNGLCTGTANRLLFRCEHLFGVNRKRGGVAMLG